MGIRGSAVPKRTALRAPGAVGFSCLQRSAGTAAARAAGPGDKVPAQGSGAAAQAGGQQPDGSREHA